MEKHKKKFLIARIFGSTINVLASGAAIVGIAAAPATGGASATIVGVATGIAWVGGVISALASLIQCVLEIEGMEVCNALLKIMKKEHLSPGQRLELVSEFFKEIIRSIEGAGTTSAATVTCKTTTTATTVTSKTATTATTVACKTATNGTTVACKTATTATTVACKTATTATTVACKTVSNADRVRKLKKITEMIDCVRKSPLAKLNGLSLLVGVADLITASVQLYKMENSSEASSFQCQKSG